MSRHLQTLFLLAVLSFLFVIPTQAQVTTASMSGTVMFQDEPVIGATVLAVHEPSGTNYGTITNVDGRFSCILLDYGCDWLRIIIWRSV